MSLLGTVSKPFTTDVVKPMTLVEALIAGVFGAVAHGWASATFEPKIRKFVDNKYLSGGVVTAGCVGVGAAAGHFVGGTVGTIIQNGLIIASIGAFGQTAFADLKGLASTYLS